MIKYFGRFFNYVKLRIKYMEEINSLKRNVEDGESDESESKRPKKDVDDEPTHVVGNKLRVKYNKYAAFLSYCGKNYYGMQINCDFPTIELELFNALRKANLIDDEDVKKPGQKLNFQRAARTDKNVSAVKQMCSIKLPRDQAENLVDLVKTINEKYLPECIRLWGFTRATQGFDSKKSCDSRTYSYTCPSFAFAHLDELTQENFRLPKERLEEINKVLQIFKGTHNFYNYTSNKKPEDKSLKRFIISFECGEAFIVNDFEFVKIKVKGQSFMLHQIRKMIGIAIANVRGLVDKSYIERSLTPKERFDVPRAPGLGLVLEEVHYEWYNTKYEKTHEKLSWEKYETNVDEFRKKFIDSVIVDTEKKEKSMLEWLATLPLHVYDVLDNNAARSTCSPLMQAKKNIDELADEKTVEEKQLNEIAQ